MRPFFFLSLIFATLIFPVSAGSFTMQSSNYKILTDVISVGGETSTSTNYKIFNTAGELGVTDTRSTSASYNIDAGFQAAGTSPNLSVTLSTDSVNLGELQLSAVSSASQILTVSTDSTTGYTTTIKEDGDLRSGTAIISAIPLNGTVTAGTAGYGISTTGGAGKMNSTTTSTPLSTIDQVLAASSTPVSGEQTVITYKAAIDGSTSYGVYSHSITFTTTVNF